MSSFVENNEIMCFEESQMFINNIHFEVEVRHPDPEAKGAAVIKNVGLSCFDLLAVVFIRQHQFNVGVSPEL